MGNEIPTPDEQWFLKKEMELLADKIETYLKISDLEDKVFAGQSDLQQELTTLNERFEEIHREIKYNELMLQNERN